ncbi:reverse transcriptase domain-containing protein [Litorimonas sp.]|uniref:reverse transcriptase domain-containing protein n=1 Tax=Litorimonas sp. TaxID=1892381 RepID=UPI003A83C759
MSKSGTCKIRFKSQNKKIIRCAGKGQSICELGVLYPIPFRIKGVNKKYMISPRVISGLNEAVNIGIDFMREIKMDLINSSYPPVLKVEGKRIPVVAALSNPDSQHCWCPRAEHQAWGTAGGGSEPARDSAEHRDPELSTLGLDQVGTHLPGAERYPPIYNLQNRNLPGNSLTFIHVSGQSGSIAVLEKELRGWEDVHLVPAIYDFKSDTGEVGIFNMSDQVVGLRKGVLLGNCRRLTPGEAEHPEQEEPKETLSSLRNKKPTTLTPAERKIILDQLNLEGKKVLLQGGGKNLDRAKELINKYAEVFSVPTVAGTTIGKTDRIQCEVKLKPGAIPFKAKVRPLNPNQRESLEKQVHDWTHEKVIAPSKSEWAHALVPVKKPDGSTRWCVDFRPLNACSKRDSFPLPRIDQNLERLQGAKIYSSLDARWAYHIIPVKKSSQDYLSFITPFGLYKFIRMPFGLNNAGAVYSRFVGDVIDSLGNKQLITYLDDVVAASQTFDEHLSTLEQALVAHLEAGIRLNPKKTFLFEEEINYLGFHISAKGIQMREDYVEKIKCWPQPRTIKQLNTFLGFTSYYRSFIPQYAKLTACMNKQKRLDQLDWNAECDHNFHELKKLFLTKPIRSYPMWGGKSGKFILRLDYSKDGIAAILTQPQQGKERFIAAQGRGTRGAEPDYPSWKGEMLALIYGLSKYEHILRFRPFRVQTDSTYLTHLYTIRNPKGILARWLMAITSYDFEVEHIPGVENGDADAVSRSDHLDPPTPSEMEEIEQSVDLAADLKKKLSTSTEFTSVMQLDSIVMNEGELDSISLRQAQDADSDLQTVRGWVTAEAVPDQQDRRHLSWSLKKYIEMFPELKIQPDGVLVREREHLSHGRGQHQVLVPQALKARVFQWSHAHVSAGHFSHASSVARAHMHFHYPGLSGDFRRLVSQCLDCHKKTTVKPFAGVHIPRRAGYTGEYLYVDLVGPLNENVDGYKYILTMEDGFSRYVQTAPIKSKNAEVVAQALIDRWVTVFGVPETLYSDGGGEFVNSIWKQLTERLDINQAIGIPYSKNANIVERFHRTLGQMLRQFLPEGTQDWVRWIGPCCMAYNSKVHSSTGSTPFYAMFQREMILPIDLVMPRPRTRYDTVQSQADETLARFHKIYAYIKDQV